MAPREWIDISDEERDARLKDMRTAAPRNATISADFPWRGKIYIDGHFTLSELRAVLAAAEGADMTRPDTPARSGRVPKTITHVSELISGLRAIVAVYGDLPLSISTTEQVFDGTDYNTSTAIREPDELRGVCDISVDI
jgi:hypothetical protein